MQRKMILILSILIVLLAGCGKQSGSDSDSKTKQNSKKYTSYELDKTKVRYGPDKPNYKMNLVYNEQKHRITGNMSVKFTNNLNKDLEILHFRLWPNSEEFGDNHLKVKNVQVNGKKADTKAKGTTLDISGISIPKEKEASVSMDIDLHIPNLAHRFGWSGSQVSLGNAFPILAVHDDHGWNLDPYFADGEAFYSLSGNYDITLETPSDQIIASTGEQDSKPIMKDKRTSYHLKAKNVRDFAIIMNSRFKKKTVSIDGVNVNVYFTDKHKKDADEMLASAQYALPHFNKTYGSYPWPELDLVTVDYVKEFNGGMEFPQLAAVNIPSLKDEEDLHLTTQHEIAHQWFYGVIGNNQYREPWLDESFATFASYVSFYETHNFDWIKNKKPKKHLTSPAAAFKDDEGKLYNDIMYDYGAKTLADLHKKLGDETFYKGMRAYYKDRKFKVATTADFIRIMEKTSGKDLKGFFQEHSVYLKETQ